MRHRSHLSASERSARSKLARLAHEDPILCGSVVRMNRKCGKPNCKCTRGERHESLCLAMKVAGKRKMVHIPKELEASVIEAVEDYQKMKTLMEEVSQGCLDRFLREKEELRTGKSKER